VGWCHDEAYHFEEQALGDVHVRRQSGFHYLDVDGDDDAHDSGGTNGSQQLSRQEQQTARGRQVTRENQAKGDGRVEQAAADAVEDPCGDEQAEAVAEGDEDDGLVGVSAAGGRLGGEADAHGVAQVGREEEEEGADELADGGDEVLSRGGPVFGRVGF